MEITALLTQVQPKTGDTGSPETTGEDTSFIHILQAAAGDTGKTLPASPAFGTGGSNRPAAEEIAPRDITADPLRAGNIPAAAPEDTPEDAAPKQDDGETAGADTAPAAPVTTAAVTNPGGGESLPPRSDSPIPGGRAQAPRGDDRHQRAPTDAEPAPASTPVAPGTTRNTGFQAADSAAAGAITNPAPAEPPVVPGGTAAEAPPANTAASSGGPAAAPAPEAPRTSAPQATLQAPVASQPWQQELGRQVVELVQRGEDRMKLRLNPRELGPLSVNLKVDDQGAQAQFFSAHAAVRGAVEQAIPQLREALAQQGIALGEASVGEQRQQSGQREAAGQSHGEGPAGDTETGRKAVPPTHVAVAPATGGVDLYA
ncbi:flagellar hook-length control protein FliK [Microbulbifer sp.]|uniref:flagellar hook-length control protein FliK n=1 Tax=Microbulbifer sp. TaxID=1908541 RepID=UPI003F3D9BC4